MERHPMPYESDADFMKLLSEIPAVTLNLHLRISSHAIARLLYCLKSKDFELWQQVSKALNEAIAKAE